MKVVVIYGGDSSERAVSLRSGESVAQALDKAGYEPVLYDPREDKGYARLRSLLQPGVIAFPIIHGKGGEDGEIQRVLEDIGAPFVGSSSTVSAVCFDKLQTLETVKAHGVRVPESDVIGFDELSAHPLAKWPFVLKPIADGSSIDVFLVKDPEHFDARIVEDAFARHDTMLIEELIDGTELTVGVLGGEALPVIEIIPPLNGEFDYENKYNGHTQELCPPEHITHEVQQQAQSIASTVHRLMGCRDLSRSDFMLSNTGHLYFLEINTLPGMTEQSLFPKAAAAAGISMKRLADQLVAMAASR